MKKLAGVAPSILSANFASLEDEVATVLKAGAGVIHIDVMDGHFVPPITMGPLIVEAIAEQVHTAGAAVDVHLMIENPDRHIKDFVAAGADAITFHIEATAHSTYVAQMIRSEGCLAGVAICPGTPIETVKPLAREIDLCLCMSVNPGWGGQPFMNSALDRLEQLRRVVGSDVVLSVDGGIDASTVGICAKSGAELFVSGSAVFGSSDPAAAYREIAAAAHIDKH